jgi:hypothetical protein
MSNAVNVLIIILVIFVIFTLGECTLKCKASENYILDSSDDREILLSEGYDNPYTNVGKIIN